MKRTVFRAAGMLLAVSLLLQCTACSGKAAGRGSSAGLNVVSLGTDKVIDVVWNPGFLFGQDTSVYNHALCKVSMALCHLNMDPEEIAAAVGSLGMTAEAQKFYDKQQGDASDTSAYTIATGKFTRDGEEFTLVGVFIRATSTAGEMISNFDFMKESGDTGIAKGFEGSAAVILDDDDATYPDNAGPSPDLSDIIGSIEGDYLLWITGYSRGAAAANYLGKLCIDKYGASRVCAYTFATPNVALEELVAGGYESIFNIISPDDTVPYLPLGGSSSWRYRRYGTDLVLKTYTIAPEQVQIAVTEFYDYLSGKPYSYFGQPGSRGSPDDADGAAVRAITDYIETEMCPSPYDYYNTPVTSYRSVFPLVKIYIKESMTVHDALADLFGLFADRGFDAADSALWISRFEGSYHDGSAFGPPVDFIMKYALRIDDPENLLLAIVGALLGGGSEGISLYEAAVAHTSANYLAWLFAGESGEVFRSVSK